MRDIDFYRWETPFADASFPSVEAFPMPESLTELVVTVAPSGLDRYPKYVVAFESVVAYKLTDESYFPARECNKLKREGPSATYSWLGSPWLAEFEDARDALRLNVGWPLNHFVILGGDTIAEVISGEEPSVREVKEPEVLAVRYAV